MSFQSWHTHLARSLLFLLPCAIFWAPAAGQSCGPAGDLTTTYINHLTRWITATDTMDIRLRDTKYMIPVVPTNTLKVVTNSKICTQAAKAYAARFLMTPSAWVYVIQMGSGSSVYYAVYDVAAESHGFGTLIIFDRNWVRIGGFSG